MPFDDEFGFRQVEYQAHYDQFAAPFLIEKNEENNRYFVNQAKENHVYGVNNALLDLISDALTMLEVVRFTKDANGKVTGLEAGQNIDGPENKIVAKKVK